MSTKEIAYSIIDQLGEEELLGFIALFHSKGIVLDQIKELCKGSTRDFLNQTILKQIIFPFCVGLF